MLENLEVSKDFRVKNLLNRFSTLNQPISIKDFAKLNSLSKNTAHMYLFRNERLGFIYSYKVGKLNFYKLSIKGKKFLDLLNYHTNLSHYPEVLAAL